MERIGLNGLRLENPYISPYLNIKSTSNFKLYAGLNSTFTESLEINIEGGYKTLQIIISTLLIHCPVLTICSI